MARDPITIDLERILLHEGKTTSLVLAPLGRHFKIQGYQHFNFESKDNFRNFLKDISVLPGFEAKVKAIAIVRDAEKDAVGAFASVRDSLLSVGLPAPEKAGIVADGPPQVGIFILPDNQSQGMVETLCMQSVVDDPAFGCVDLFFKCVHEKSKKQPSNMDKARAQAFLATRAEVEYHVGRAADSGHWNFDHKAFAPLVEFLRSLAN